MVDVLANDIRTIVRYDVPFIAGAYVNFYDGITVNDVRKAQQIQETPTLDDSLAIIIAQIHDWNFTTANGENLPINVNTFNQFTLKLLDWFTQTQGEILAKQQAKKKESLEISSNP